MQLTLFAYAKVNLRLKVVGRNKDGYHLLSMINVLVNLHDTIRVDSTLQEHSLETPGWELGSAEGNLAVRAWNLARLKLSDPHLFPHISLQKKIPAQGGMGGGSTDAAAVLRAAQQVAPSLTFTSQELLSLGADVPYFFHAQKGKAYWVTGIGEECVQLPPFNFPGCELFLLFPEEPSSTPQVFSRYRLAFPDLGERGEDSEAESLLQFSTLAIEDLKNLVENDLTSVALDTLPKTKALLQTLKERGFTAGMTGSGSTLFVLPSVGITFTEEELFELKKTSKGQAQHLLTTF